MHLRHARHTANLQTITGFYVGVLGLEKLGAFTGHAGYDGVFLGLPGAGWHLEFTTNAKEPATKPGDDDLLVFYYYSSAEVESIVQQARKLGLEPIKPKNPYWQANGITLTDPDGYHIVLAVKNMPLTSPDPLTHQAVAMGATDWESLCTLIRNMPFGRNKNRHDFSLVFSENRGSCSSKHALLKTIADLNGIPQVKLIMSIYKMNQRNTPGIGDVLSKNKLDHLPEAHCYLSVNGALIDLTNRSSSYQRIGDDLLEWQAIEPAQVAEYKVNHHRRFFKTWAANNGAPHSFEELWQLREQCIANLSA